VFREDNRLIAGGARVYLGAGVLYPSDKLMVEGSNVEGISLTRIKNTIKKLDGNIRIYVESSFSREVCEATVEHSINQLLKLVKNVRVDPPTNWKSLMYVEGYFPTINSFIDLTIEDKSLDYSLIAIPMEDFVVELPLEDVRTKEFSILSKLYTNKIGPSSSIRRLLNKIKPIVYSYNGSGLYIIIEKRRLMKAIEELLKIFDPDLVKVYGLDNIPYRIYNV